MQETKCLLLRAGELEKAFQEPSTEPIRAGGLDGSAAAEERDNYHRDAYMNDRNHASGAPRPGRE